MIKTLLKTDMTSIYSMTDDQQEETHKNQLNKSFHQNTPPVPLRSSSRSSKEKLKDNEIIKPIEKRTQSYNQSTVNKTILKTPISTNLEHKDLIHRSNVFTSSSHSMVDPGCGGHFLSKIPALRCLRPNKQHHTQKFHKTSPIPPPPCVVR